VTTVVTKTGRRQLPPGSTPAARVNEGTMEVAPSNFLGAQRQGHGRRVVCPDRWRLSRRRRLMACGHYAASRRRTQGPPSSRRDRKGRLFARIGRTRTCPSRSYSESTGRSSGTHVLYSNSESLVSQWLPVAACSIAGRLCQLL
jgi:hypothetical protein